jgi:hypothetical protein
LTRAQVWAIHASNLLVGSTGLVYGWMRYFAQPADEFSIVNHPWQPELQHAHVLLAPLLVFCVGLVWSAHVWRRWLNGHPLHRKSGLAMALTFFPMIVSGYALQVSEEESWRLAWIYIHVATSCVWLLFGVIHPLLPKPKAQASPLGTD